MANQARLLIAGPAAHVHTSVDGVRSVSLFVVDAVNGDDRDCALPAPREIPLAQDARGSVRVAKGHELCVASSERADVSWHARLEASPRAIALQ